MILSTPHTHKKSIKNKIILLALLFLAIIRVDVFAKAWGFDMYVVREDDQSEGFKDSKEYFTITYGRWGGLEVPFTGEVNLGVDGREKENHEDFMDHTTWFWHWYKFHYISWNDYGKNHKRNGGKRIQFSLCLDGINVGLNLMDKQAEVLLLQSYGFKLVKYWKGNLSNWNFLMELPEGYMFYME